MRRVPGVCLVAVLSTTLPVVAVGQTSGQPAMYATSSTYYSSSQYQDAHLSDSGNDMSQAINATWAKCTALTGVAGPVACAIEVGYTGYQVWTVNPFGNDTFNGGDVDLCAAGVTDIRVGGPSVAGVFPQFGAAQPLAPPRLWQVKLSASEQQLREYHCPRLQHRISLGLHLVPCSERDSHFLILFLWRMHYRCNQHPGGRPRCIHLRRHGYKRANRPLRRGSRYDRYFDCYRRGAFPI